MRRGWLLSLLSLSGEGRASEKGKVSHRDWNPGNGWKPGGKTSNLTVSKSGVKGAVVPLPRRLSLEWVLEPSGTLVSWWVGVEGVLWLTMLMWQLIGWHTHMAGSSGLCDGHTPTSRFLLVFGPQTPALNGRSESGRHKCLESSTLYNTFV